MEKILALKEACEGTHEELKISSKGQHWEFNVPFTKMSSDEFLLLATSKNKKKLEKALEKELRILEESRKELFEDIMIMNS